MKAVKALFLHIHDWLCAHKGVAALLLAVILALCAISALRLDFQEDITAFLPREQRVQLEKTEGQEQMAVFFTGGTLEDKLDAMYAFQDQWNALCPEVPIEAAADNSQVWEAFDFLSANWPYFLEEADYHRMDSLLADNNFIGRKMAENKEALYSANPFFSRYVRTDPLGLYSPVLQRLQAARPQTRLEEDCLFTPDGSTGILFFLSPYGGAESGKNAQLVLTLREVKKLVCDTYPQVSIQSTGGPEVAAENASRIKKDSFLALIVAMLLIGLVLWFSYKRIADVLWILLSIGAGALFALGIMALFKSSISIIVLGIGCTVIGIAVNYPLHYVDHLKYQPNKRKALAEQVNPLLVGNITTVGAFLGLLLLKADALHDFGFLGAMTLVGTIFFVLLFLPVFVPAAKAPRKTLQLDADRFLTLDPNTRKGLFLGFLGATICLALWASQVRFDANLHNINYMTQEQAEGFALLESLRPNADAFPLPDAQEQEARIALWNAFWQRHADLSDKIIDAGLQEGFTAHAFQPFFDALDQDWQVQERTYFRPVDFAPEQGTGDLLVQALSEDFDTIGLLCSLIVLLFLWLSFGSLDLTIISFLPLAVSWIWIQGIMGLTGLQFNIVNIVLATFIFGMGDDYSIFITEGLVYERATGKKILHSYKNAVMLSGLIMFIGIGALVLAKHPAMRSLGLVTVIGMATVVGMAYYLPPLVFRWLTSRNGKPRTTPLSLGALLRTGFIFLNMALWMILLSLITLLMPKGLVFHRLIRGVASMAIHCVPGCRYKVYNPHGEDFSKPAIYICNHQSHLDVLALIALQPKLIFMTNDWVWNFPFYGAVLRKAGYFPSSWGLSRNSAHVKKLVAEGYSIVIFPEGTRTIDGRIHRFHRGAFLAAQELGLDILPLCIHGFHYALPKHDFLLRKAGLSLEIGQRISVPAGADLAAFTREMRHFYMDWYESIRLQRETAAYMAPFVYRQYLYKGHEALQECRKVLRRSVYAEIDALDAPSLEIREAGCGVKALLIALSHPQMQVLAYEADEDKYLTASRCQLPANLQYRHE